MSTGRLRPIVTPASPDLPVHSSQEPSLIPPANVGPLDSSEPATSTPSLARRGWLTLQAGGNLAQQDMRLALQVAALDMIQRTFSNQFGTDTHLKQAVAAKQAAMQVHARGAEFVAALTQGTELAEQQRSALRVVLSTFTGANDAELRSSVSAKLAEVGEQGDWVALSRRIKKGNGRDISEGLKDIASLCERHGSPARKGVSQRTKSLLNNPSRTEGETKEAISAVLRDSPIVASKRHQGTNLNEVYFLTFDQAMTLPDGTAQVIRGVWKPERMYEGKTRSFYGREVAVYDLDNEITGTGLVPPTVETVIDGRVGSLQFMVPNAKPAGKNLTEWAPEFDPLRQTPAFEQQMAQLKTLLFVVSDPDKLPNNVHAQANLQNLMIDNNGRLWMIDNAFSLGAPDGEVSIAMLPNTDTPALQQLREGQQGKGQTPLDVLSKHVSRRDAEAAVERTRQAIERSAKRARKVSLT